MNSSFQCPCMYHAWLVLCYVRDVCSINPCDVFISPGVGEEFGTSIHAYLPRMCKQGAGVMWSVLVSICIFIYVMQKKKLKAF